MNLMNRLSWIFVGATVLIIAVIIGVFMRPQIMSMWQIYQKNQKNSQELKDSAQEKKILESYSQDQQFKTVYNNAINYIPQDQETDNLIIGLSALATQNNLSVSSFSFDTTKSAATTSTNSTNSSSDSSASSSSSSNSNSNSNSNSSATTSSSTASELKFSIKLTGSFPDFENYLKGIETSNRLISIASMTLSQNATSGLSVQLSGKTYWKKDVSLEQTLANLTVSKAVINKFLSLKTYGTPINLPTESGFGRADPFAGF